ncbi:glycogen synthase [Olivibacter sitiensis]|uniref:glycogen synthase n=1 Tax=Olivibacter sitiensis TaxID=376470 RepID=UPI000417B3F2|nr:glycogen/starch synthase [Olivibacter sitiensis]
MFVIHFSAECYPVAKVGGLADVLGALPKYQQQAGLRAAVVMPYVRKPFVESHEMLIVHSGEIVQDSVVKPYVVLKERHDVLGFELYLIQIPGLLDREEVYCYPDESLQFLAFQHAALQWICFAGLQPDIIHCHDHHVGLIPFFLENVPLFRRIKRTPTVATIHNAQYQGWQPWDMLRFYPPFDDYRAFMLEYNGQINPLASLVRSAWHYTTVSEGYLRELFREANGLERLFAEFSFKATGIVNGIDKQVWDTKNDPMLANNYSLKDAGRGKQANKLALCEQYGLDVALPLVVFIGRFALEKGADLLPSVIRQVLNNNQGKVNFLVLGSGDAQVTWELQQLFGNYSQQMGLYIGYNEGLAHQIYASADFLLMPSWVEPCGLNQLYALRYGTIPIVSATGGLRDTVIDISEPNGYGFLFSKADIGAAVTAIERAISLFENNEQVSKIRKHIMQLDFSWEKSAAKYQAIYTELVEVK